MAKFQTEHLRSQGDNSMKRKRWGDAADKYAAAWRLVTSNPAEREAYTPERAFWLMMAGLEAAFRAGQHGAVLGMGKAAHQQFARFEGLVVGNPYFHLRMGQAKFERQPGKSHETGPGTALDELTRALICGGTALFREEDPTYLAAVQAVLDPPDGFASWDEAGEIEGAATEVLRGAEGYLGAMFERLIP